MKIYDIQDIEMIHKSSGGHFFDAESKRFFNSRILETVYQGTGGVFFVTSEKAPNDTERGYTIRQFNPETGSVSTVGTFNIWTKAGAQATAKYLSCKKSTPITPGTSYGTMNTQMIKEYYNLSEVK